MIEARRITADNPGRHCDGRLAGPQLLHELIIFCNGKSGWNRSSDDY